MADPSPKLPGNVLAFTDNYLKQRRCLSLRLLFSMDLATSTLPFQTCYVRLVNTDRAENQKRVEGETPFVVFSSWESTVKWIYWCWRTIWPVTIATAYWVSSYTRTPPSYHWVGTQNLSAEMRTVPTKRMPGQRKPRSIKALQR